MVPAAAGMETVQRDDSVSFCPPMTKASLRNEDVHKGITTTWAVAEKP